MATSTSDLEYQHSFQNVSNQLLDLNKDCNKIVIALKDIHHKWNQLAAYLNIPNGTIASIAGKYNNDHFRQMSDVISTWISIPTREHHPSKRVLCQALAAMGEIVSAEKIAKIKEDQSTNVYDGTSRDKKQPADHSERIHQLHILWQTPVAIAVQQGNAIEAAKELENDFDVLVAKFLLSEISRINVDELRYQISKHFQKEEGTIDEEIEKHLTKIEDYNKPSAVLNYFQRHRFIGYVNYSLIKVFQKIAKSPLLDKRIEDYEKDYQCFLELSLAHIHDTFQQCPDLRPDYPAGIPKFTIHLESEWDGKSMLELRELLKRFANSDCIDQLMIADISRSCIIITFAVLPHIARQVLGYLTNDDVIKSMKKEGISVDISKQLMKYEEELETTDSIASMEQTPKAQHGLETNPSYSSRHTIKPDWDTAVTNTTSGGDSAETDEYFQLVELKEDVTLKEAVDTYESVVTMLQERIKSLENQLVTHKQMMMELDNTKESLKQLTQEHNSARESIKQVTLERDNTRDELKKIKLQSMNLLQSQQIRAKSLVPGDQLDKELLVAAENGDIELIETLIKSGANVNTTSTKRNTDYHRTPLHKASSKGHCEAVNLLISLGAKVDKMNDLGETPLHEASHDSNSNDTVSILLSNGANANKKDNMGYTPLHLASIQGYSDIVNTLISHGATINEKSVRGDTPLHKASSQGHSDIVNTLISHGATINEKDNSGYTPLHFASEYNHSDTVNVLLSNGAIVNSLNDKYHQTPLSIRLSSDRGSKFSAAAADVSWS